MPGSAIRIELWTSSEASRETAYDLAEGVRAEAARRGMAGAVASFEVETVEPSDIKAFAPAHEVDEDAEAPVVEHKRRGRKPKA